MRSLAPVRGEAFARMAARLLGGLLLVALAAAAWAQRMPVATPADLLEPGQYTWQPELSADGPFLLVVSLSEQRAHVFRNGVRIAVSTVSTGMPGYETPTGVFTILQKRREHYSNLYDDAPMPFMQRLTWSGVALHAGSLPGHPASHGCVRLPHAFAERLFAITRTGMTVVIADEAFALPEFAHPDLVLPWGLPADEVPAAYMWEPERSPAGPVAVVLSAADRRVVVLRNGVKIGEATLQIDGEDPLGTSAYTLLQGYGKGMSRFVPGERRLNWMPILLDEPATGREASDDALARRLRIPEGFAREIHRALAPGATVLVTDAPFRTRAAGVLPDVIVSEPPVAAPGD